jgi:hypothetical protein
MSGPGIAGFSGAARFGTGSTIAIAWGDFDRDNDLDMAVGNYNQQNWLFVNNGDTSFAQQDQFGQGYTFAAVWVDFDNDGDLDLAVGNGRLEQNSIYVNNLDGTFTLGAGLGKRRTNALAWGDYDRDGDLDVALGNGLQGNAEPNRLFTNNGDGTFSSAAEFGAGQSASVVWGDFDNDGDLDLAVGNGGFGYIEQNYLYVNNIAAGDTSFTERAEFGLGDTACLVWGDYDNDGDLDMAVANWDGGQNYLYVNNGDGSFTGQAQFGMRDPNTMAWGDCDNDGDLDLAVGNGDFGSADSNYLYLNNGDGTFTEQSEFGQGSTDGVAWGDYDNDGDLDLAVGNEHSPPQNYLFVNNENDSDYLIIRLVGHFHDQGMPFSNRDGIGARVSVFEAGHLGDPAHLLGYRQTCAHGGFASQNSMDAHFGLPGRSTVDVRIVWPGSGGSNLVQDALSVAVGQYLTVHEGDHADVGTTPPPISSIVLECTPNPFKGVTKLELGASRGDRIDARVFDIRGRLVAGYQAVAASEKHTFQWDGKNPEGRELPPGIYFWKVQIGNQVAIRKVVMAR